MKRSSAGQSATLLAMVLLFAAAACGGNEHKAGPQPISNEFRQGLLAVRLELTAARLTTAEGLTLRILALAPEDYTVSLPSPLDEIGGFHIVQRSAPEPELRAEGVYRRVEYQLRPGLPGDYTIPSFTISAESRGAQERVTTEPVAIQVVSVLPAGGTAELTDIFGPRLLRSRRWWPLLTIASLAASALWLLRRRRRAPAAALPPPPHERACAALDQLLKERLPERGEMKLYYVRLSEILREYIEERFGLRAPERTTEEFLRELDSAKPFQPHAETLLREFLDHCDLVKFARYAPAIHDAEESHRRCRTFITGTASREAQGGQHVPV